MGTAISVRHDGVRRAISEILSFRRRVGSHPLTRQCQFKTFFRYIAWQTRSRFSRTPYRFHWIESAVLMIRRGMHGATSNLYFGLAEFPDMGFMLHLLRPGDLFIDVGANVGVYTVLASKVCGARVIAFEPAQETLPDFRANIAANDIGDRIDLRTSAVGATSGSVSFTTGLDCVNHIASDGDGQTAAVDIVSLDEALSGHHPILIKIDVEGFEPDVIAGAAATIQEPTLLAIEIETVEPAILMALTDAGFVERSYDPFSRTLSSPLPVSSGNRLFVRDEPALIARLKSAPSRQVHNYPL